MVFLGEGAVSYERGTASRVPGGSCGVVRFLMGEVPLYPADTIRRLLPRASRHFLKKEFFVDNLLVRLHLLIDDFSRPALRHGSLNSRFPGRLTPTFRGHSLVYFSQVDLHVLQGLDCGSIE